MKEDLLITDYWSLGLNGDYKNALIRIKELADASANTPEYKELQRIKELVHHYEKQHPEVEVDNEYKILCG